MLAVRNEALAQKWVAGINAAWSYQNQLQRSGTTEVVPEDKKVVLELDDKKNKIVQINNKSNGK